jgi:ribokinase
MPEFTYSGSVLCMGAINIDLTMYLDHLPAQGETIITDNFQTFPGGKGGNQAVTASVLGGAVHFFGKLGGDDFSDNLVGALQEKSVDVSGIIRDQESTAGIAMIWVDAHGQNSIAFTPGANAKLTPQDVANHPEQFRAGAILLVTGEIPSDTAWEAVRMAKKNGMYVILDPAPPPKDGVPTDIPQLVDIVKPNETEAAMLTGIRVVDFLTAEKAVERLQEMGFSAPIVTLGEQGVVAGIDNQIIRIEPLPVKSVDSTAAGDVFSGAMAAYLSQGGDIIDALHFAKTAAALSTTMPGAQTSIPTLEQVKAHM